MAQSKYANVAVIIPVYNEAPVIRDVVDKALRAFSCVVCVNDGSTDGSDREIDKTNAYLVQHPINMGQGAALQTGIEFARRMPSIRYFVTFDADGQHRIEDIEAMLDMLKTEKLDVVLGSRFLGRVIGMKRSKQIILRGAVWFSNATTGLKLTDTHNGLRVFNRKVANEMQITLSDMAHASEILEIIAKYKYKYAEVPVTIEYTDYSRSKGQPVINGINILFDMLLRRISK